MKYDFDELVERRGTGCVKWDESKYPDVIPLWVADMDFKAAPAILEAVRKRAEHGVFGYTVVEDDYPLYHWCGASDVGSHQGTHDAW